MEQKTFIDLLKPFRLRDPNWEFYDRKTGKRVNLYREMAKLSMDIAFQNVGAQDLKSVDKALELIEGGSVLDADIERAQLAFLLLQGMGRV